MTPKGSFGGRLKRYVFSFKFWAVLISSALLASPALAAAKKAQASKPLVLAQNSQLAITQPTTSSTLTEKKEEEKKFSMGLSLSHSQNLYEASQYEKTSGYAFEFAPAYKFSENSSVSALGAVVADTKDRENAAILKNTLVAWSFMKIPFNKKISFTPALIAVLPTNQISARDEKYRGTLGAKATFAFSDVGATNLNIALASSIRKNMNDYDISADGTPLVEYSFPQEVKVDYAFSEKVSSSFLARSIFAKTYAGFDRQKFLMNLSLGYAITKQWSISTGVTNEGDSFKADGVGSNIRLFDAETTEVYFGVGLSI